MPEPFANWWQRLVRTGLLEPRWILAGIFTFGVLLRISQYVGRRSLWMDEALLALNFFDGDVKSVLSPLGLVQAAPAGFNLLSLFAVSVAGMSERALRFFPLVFGIVSIFVFWRLSRRWLQGGALLFANYAFAISNKLVYFSNEFKPYILDAFAAMIVFGGLVSWWEDGRARNRLPALAILGCLAVWFSFPVVFVMAGVGSVILAACWKEKKYTDFWRLAVVVATWLVSFACQYVFFARPVMKVNGPELTQYWLNHGAFMPLQPWKDPAWFATSFADYFDHAAGLRFSFFTLQFIFICGIIELVRRREFVRLGALLAPFVIAIIVSGFELYPFQERMILYTVPFALLICGEGIEGLFRWIRPPALGVLVVGIALFMPSAQAFSLFFYPKQREEVRPLAEYLQRKATPQDVVLVFNNNPSVRYYTRLLKLPQIMLPISEENYSTILPRITDELRQGHHCWLIISHVQDGMRDSIVSHLKPVCRPRTVDLQTGAELLAIDPL